MKYLVDDLVLQGKIESSVLAQWKHIDINEAAIQFHQSFLDGDEYDRSEAFTNVAPAFPYAMYEFNFPNPKLWKRMVVLCVARLASEPYIIPLIYADKFESKKPKWVLYFSVFGEHPEAGAVKMPILFVFFIREDGRIVTTMDGSSLIWCRLADADWNHMYRKIPSISLSPTKDIKEVVGWTSDLLVNPALFAIGLMHCKNVTLEATATQFHSKKHKRKLKDKPLLEHHTIVIRDRKGRVVNYAATVHQASQPGQQRLHWTRGHYTRYTPEAPAFGKPWGVGTFWFPACLKGTAAAGKIDSSYKISA